MEAATIIATAHFPERAPEARKPGRYQALDLPQPQETPRGRAERSGVRAKQAGSRTEGSWGMGAEPGPGPDGGQGRVQERYAGLGQAPPPQDRVRLSSPRRLDVGNKRPSEPDEDALMAEIARGYSREYRGREGWTAGALYDSLVYTFRLARKSASRPLAVRRLSKERAARERVRQDQLTELGEAALALRDLRTPVLGEFRDRLLEIDQDVEMRDEEMEELKTRLAEADRAFLAAERQHVLEDQELAAQGNAIEEQLRPEEAAHRNALTKARAAEKDAYALAQQIDRAQAELPGLGQRPGSGQDIARQKDRIAKWEADRKILEEEAPRLAEKAALLLPEIEQLRKELARAQQARRDHREEGVKREAEHRRERSRLMQEMERLNVVKAALSATRRGIWLDCGRQIEIDRPTHDRLEEIYHVIDNTAVEIRRIEKEIEIARSRPDPPSWDALKRAGVALSVVFVLFILFLVIIT